MMTKKSEMAEWVLDFFRRAKVQAGQIMMFRNIQFAQQQFNPKERSLFLNVMNELLEQGYFTFEQEPLQGLRLTEKGFDYIYDDSAVLECCRDRKFTPAQEQYIAELYQNFVSFIERMKDTISAMMLISEASEEDKRWLKHCLDILDGSDAQEIEKDLSEGNVSKMLLDRIEKLNKELVDIAVEHLHTKTIMKEFIRTLTYIKLEQDRKAEEMRLGKLNIGI